MEHVLYARDNEQNKDISDRIAIESMHGVKCTQLDRYSELRTHVTQQGKERSREGVEVKCGGEARI